MVYTKRINIKDSVFHVHGGATIAPIIAARFFKIPVVWTIHETVSNYKGVVKLGLKILKNISNKLVIVAESSRKTYPGFNDAALIPGAIDESFWEKKSELSAEVNGFWFEKVTQSTSNTFRILIVANLTPIKGIDLLLNSLLNFDIPWELNIVGMPFKTHESYLNKIQKLSKSITNNDKKKKVRFLGWQDREQVRNLLSGCDVFVLPSRSEACPLVLLEAMAMNCNCIASDVGDVKRMLKNYKKARTFTSENTNELLLNLKDIQKDMNTEHSDEQVKFPIIYTIQSLASSYDNIYSSFQGNIK